MTPVNIAESSDFFTGRRLTFGSYDNIPMREKRQAGAHSGRLHAGKRLRAIDQFAIEGLHLRFCLVFRFRQHYG